jgi:hypothetical protein
MPPHTDVDRKENATNKRIFDFDERMFRIPSNDARAFCQQFHPLTHHL